MKLLLFYLTDPGRHFTFEPYVKLLQESSSKDQWKLIILTHDESVDFYRNILDDTNINHSEFVFHPHNNYMTKVNFAIQYAKQNNFPYMLKCDNDLFFRGRTLDYMIDNLYLLDNSNNLTIGPVLSSGIPGVEYFCEQFLTDEQRTQQYQYFLKTQLTDIWGATYTHHNKYTIQATEWNGHKFFEDVKQNSHYYKGIHPVRVNLDAIQYLNSCIISNKSKFYENLEMSVIQDNTSPYLCDSTFAIRTDIYEKIVSDPSLFVDDFDEVPLNKYAWNHSMSHLFVKNGFGIHMYYNTIPNNRIYEQQFVQQFFY